MMKAKVGGSAVDEGAYEKRVGDAVRESVRLQAENGVDVLSDGEQGDEPLHKEPSCVFDPRGRNVARSGSAF